MVSLTDVEPFFRVALMGFALVLMLLTGVAARRAGSVKLLLVAAGFLVFFVKGLILTLGLFLASFNQAFWVSPELILIDFLILALIYAGMAKGS